ncbi:ketohexokinase isoform X2 [Paramuricea clavata]|uniref:Ketohexokinase isoform X2 n=2 Tax=Paramuricea clavata TaxID=317549 RepID=A0A6S7JBH9_PARCT|nr:ketohexokinase isoform X2 [Paramuricea clavata]
MENSTNTLADICKMADARTREMKRILVVGLACLDIINTVDRYPREDEDTRALSQRWQKGGNAANTAVVLTQTLDTSCELLCSLNTGIEGQYVKEDLQKRGVLIENCPVNKNCGFPTSCVLINSVCGSRTIIHARNNLPELELTDFDKLDLSLYSWIHFEGRRNVDEIIKMIKKVRDFGREQKLQIKISVEFEKKRPEFEPLFKVEADVIFIGKDFAQFSGFTTPEETVNGLSTQVHSTSVLICPWGERGAVARGCDKEICSSPAYPPERVVDTLGAGDTFIAGVIFCLNRGRLIKDAIQFGCQLAGKKCGIQGFDGLKVTQSDSDIRS